MVKLPPFWFSSENCRNFGHVTLTRWVFKSLLSRNFCSEIFWECLKNILLDIWMNFMLKKHRFCWSRKLYSSLNVTLTYFLDQSMNFIYQEEIFFFLLIFCLINGINLGWCFFFCLFTHFIWNRIYVTQTQAFYAWQLVSWAPLLALCRSMKSQLGRICPWRRKTFQLTPFFKAVEIKESRKRSSVVPSLDGNLE